MTTFVSMFFFVLLLSSLVLFVIGMIKPSLVKAKSRAKAAQGCLYLFAASFVLMGVFAPAKPKTPQNAAAITETAAIPEYKIFKYSDYSMPDRKRINIRILADDAKTRTERVAVVVHAARQTQKEESAHVVRVALEPSEIVSGGGSAFALATYIPDGCDQGGSPCDGKIWNVEAADTQVSARELAIWEAWKINRDKFEEKHGLSDHEDYLKAFLAKEFDTTPEKITLPRVTRTPVSI